jgi:hypothetical protein
METREINTFCLPTDEEPAPATQGKRWLGSVATNERTSTFKLFRIAFSTRFNVDVLFFSLGVLKSFRTLTHIYG